MAEFERTALVFADPKAVFGVLANPRTTASWTHGRLPLQTEGEGIGVAYGTPHAAPRRVPGPMATSGERGGKAHLRSPARRSGSRMNGC
jgi:hypothetical protein